MAAPDFSKKTVDTLARRARFQCSNPNCRAQTIGPNCDPEKSTTIGEAAHIMGAKPGSARFDNSMSDVTRASITNGIWLCRNCHRKIDLDATAFTADLLFAWRKDHEEIVARELGTRGDRLRYDADMAPLNFLAQYPPIIQRIVIDKPTGWEWRFVAELMRHLNEPQFKRLNNLTDGYYYNPVERVSGDEFMEWLIDRTKVMANLTQPLVRLMDRLTASWGEPGEEGNVEEMHDVCILIRDSLINIIDFEEEVHFANIPDDGEEIRSLFKNAIGTNVKKLSIIPEKLDEMVELIEKDHDGTIEQPTVIKWTLEFELPKNFNKKFEEALQRYQHAIASQRIDTSPF